MRGFAAFSLLFASIGSLVVLIVIGVPYAASFSVGEECIDQDGRWVCGFLQLSFRVSQLIMDENLSRLSWPGMGGVAAVGGVLAVYIGAVLVRVLARATPLAADGQRHWTSILTLVAFLPIALVPVF